MLNVIHAKCQLCWMSQISPLCWVSWRPVKPRKIFLCAVKMQSDVSFRLSVSSEISYHAVFGEVLLEQKWCRQCNCNNLFQWSASCALLTNYFTQLIQSKMRKKWKKIFTCFPSEFEKKWNIILHFYSTQKRSENNRNIYWRLRQYL